MLSLEHLTYALLADHKDSLNCIIGHSNISTSSILNLCTRELQGCVHFFRCKYDTFILKNIDLGCIIILYYKPTFTFNKA